MNRTSASCRSWADAEPAIPAAARAIARVSRISLWIIAIRRPPIAGSIRVARCAAYTEPAVIARVAASNESRGSSGLIVEIAVSDCRRPTSRLHYAWNARFALTLLRWPSRITGRQTVKLEPTYEEMLLRSLRQFSAFSSCCRLGGPRRPETPAPPPACQDWLKTPTLSIMTGFIYEPLKPYTIQQWMENLGNKFDAHQWVKDFKEAGASHLVFYDKWIDGLVFHDTKTTGFKTKRDFVRELAAACQRGGLPLVIYFNAVSDGNPEFDRWALLDRQGKPIVFCPQWPTRYQTLHSPFRQKAVEQVREISATTARSTASGTTSSPSGSTRPARGSPRAIRRCSASRSTRHRGPAG